MFKNFLISQEDSLKDALKLITKNGCKTVVVVKKNTFLGTLSDGDIRKAVLNKNNLNKKIIKFYNRNSIFLKKNSYTSTEAQKIFLKNNLDLIPVIDNQKNLYKILTWKEIFNTERKIKKIIYEDEDEDEDENKKFSYSSFTKKSAMEQMKDKTNEDRLKFLYQKC